jgi:hypothetical protein
MPAQEDVIQFPPDDFGFGNGHLSAGLPAAGSLTRPETATGALARARFSRPIGGKRGIGIGLHSPSPA